MGSATISTKHQLVLPKDARTGTPLPARTKVDVISLNSDRIMITRASDRLKRMRGMGKEMWRAAGGAEKYLKQERASWRD